MAYGSIASLAVDISADIGRLRSDFQQANREATKQMSDLQKNVKSSLDSIEGQARKAGQAVLASLGAIGAIEITKRLAEVADGYQNVQAKLKLVTKDQQELNQASSDAFNIAQKTYTSYDATATLIGRVTRSLETLGGEHVKALKDSKALSEVMAEGLAISGATASESSAAIIQMTQALASNKLAGDEFRSFMENAPRLSQALSSALGVTIGDLRELSKEGKLNTEIVVKALLSQAAAIENEFTNVPLTVGRAWQQLTNYFTVYIGAGAQATGISKGLAEALVWVGENLDTIGKVAGAGGILLVSRQMASVVTSTMEWIQAQQLSAAWTQANMINAAKDAQAMAASAAATAAAAQSKVAAAKAAQAEAAATASVIVAAQEEQVVKLRAVQVEIAMTEATLAAARARGAQSAAIAVAMEAEANLTRLQAARMGIVNELAALGVNNARSMTAQTVAAEALAVAEAELAGAQTAAAAAAGRAAAAQTAAAGASGAVGVGIAGLGRGLLAFVGGPVGLTIAGVAALGYALYALGDSSDSASKKADELIAQFNKAAAAAKNFSVDPIKQINLSTDEVMGDLKKELEVAEKDLSTISQKLSGATGRMVDMYGGQAAQAQSKVDSLRQKINELGVSSAMAAEAERERSSEMAKGNKLAEEARKLLEQQTGKTGDNSKELRANAKAWEADRREMEKYQEIYAKWVEQTTTGFNQVRDAVDPMEKVNQEFKEQNEKLDEARMLWAAIPEKMSEVERVQKLVNARYKEQQKAAKEALDPSIKGIRDVNSQIKKQDDVLAGLNAAQQQYNQSVREANEQAAQAIALGGKREDVEKGLAKWIKKLGELRDKTAMSDFISEFENAGGGFDVLVKKIQDAEKALESLGETGDEALREKLLKSIDNAKRGLTSGLITTTQEGLRGIQSLTQQGSKEFAVLEVAIQGLAFANAVSAILAQGALPPPAGFAAMAAMAAAVAPLLASIGAAATAFGGGGGPSHQSAEYRQEHQGTGSILGDVDAKSESMANALDITANATTELVGLNRGMLSALVAMQNALGAAGNQIARGAADAQHPGLSNQTYGSLGPMGDYLDPALNLLTGSYDPIGQAIGGFLWGGKQKIIDQGIVIAGGTLQEMLQDIVVGAYQTIHTSGGLFGHSSTGDDITDISDTFGKQFQLVIQSIADTVRSGATALGLLPDDVEQAIANFRVEEIRISLKDLSAEDQQKELEAVFSKLFDDLAGSVVPFIADFQQVGEGLGETLVRVATEVQVAQEAFRQFGMSVNGLDPEQFAHMADSLIQASGGLDAFMTNFQKFVASFASDEWQFQTNSEALTTALSEVGLTLPDTRDGMWELMQSLDATTEEGQKQIATLLRLSDAADQYYTALDKQNEALDDARQMLDDMGFTNVMSDFRKQIKSIQDQANKAIDAYNLLARAAGRSGASEAELASVHRWAADQARKAIVALRSSTMDLISQLYGGEAGTLDEINRRIQAIEEANNAQIDGINDAGNAALDMWNKQKDAIKQISDFLDSLMLGDLTTLTPQEQLMEAQRQYQELLARAQAGDADAMAALPEAARAYLDQARSFYSATDDYSQIFQDVTGALQDIAGMDIGNPPPGSGNNGTGGAMTPAELQQLYDQRDAMLAQQDAANRLLLAQQLAQQLGDLSQALGIPVFQLADQMGVSMDLLVQDLGVDLSNFTDTTGSELAGIADMLGVTVPELAAQLGVSMADLVTSMGLNLDDLSANTAESIGNVAATLGLTVPELTAALGLSMTDLVSALGINLDDLTVQTVEAMAQVAGDMGISLTDLAESVGVDLGDLADSQSLLNQSLADTIDGLPDGTRDALRPLLQAITEATNEADANAAIQALKDATEDLPDEQKAALEPYFEQIDPTDQLDDLDWLSTISTQANNQLLLLGDIKDYLRQIAEDSGGHGTNSNGLPAYADGTPYVSGDQVAQIHNGEMVIDAASAAALRTYGIEVHGTTGNAAVASAIDKLRECMEDSDEQTRQVLIDRLEALEEAVYGGANKMGTTVAAAVGRQRNNWSK